MTADDELEVARRTGRAAGESAPPPTAELRNRLHTILQDHMRAHTRAHQEVSRATKDPPITPGYERRRRRR